MVICAISLRILVHVVMAGVFVKAIQKDNRVLKKNIWQTDTSKQLRLQRHAGDDEFSFLKSARRANEIVRSLERIENEQGKLSVERRSDIAHVIGSNKRGTSYRNKVGPAREKKRYFVAKMRWPVSPRKIYHMDPESFTPLYKRKIRHSFKRRVGKTTLLSNPNHIEEISIPLKKEINSGRSFKNNAIVAVPKPEHRRLSVPLAKENIRIDFTTPHAQKTNFFDSENTSVETSGADDEKPQDAIALSVAGSGSGNSQSSFTKTINNDVFESSGARKIDASSMTSSGSGDKYLESSRVDIRHLKDSLKDNTLINYSNDPITNPRKNDLEGDLVAAQHEDFEGSRNGMSDYQVSSSDQRSSSSEYYASGESGDNEIVLDEESKRLSNTEHETSGVSGFEFPLVGESAKVNSKPTTYKGATSGDDDDGTKDLMVLNSGYGSGSGVTSNNKEATKLIIKKKEQKLNSEEDDNLNSGDKKDEQIFSGNLYNYTKMSPLINLDNEVFGEDDEFKGNRNIFNAALDKSSERDKGSTSGNDMDRVGSGTNRFRNKGKLSDGSGSGEFSSTSTSVTKNYDVDGNTQNLSPTVDFVSGESGSGEVPNIQEDRSGMYSGDSLSVVSGVPDAQKETISALPTSQSDRISNSLALKKISKQLGFPNRIAKAPKKSHDEQSLPSAGTYSEEPDLIKSDENEDFEDSSGENSGEGHLEGSAVKDDEGSGSGTTGIHQLSSFHDQDLERKTHLFRKKEKTLFVKSKSKTSLKEETEKKEVPSVNRLDDEGTSKSNHLSRQSNLSAEQDQSTEEDNRKLAAALAKVEQQLVTRLGEIEAKNKQTKAIKKLGQKHFDDNKDDHHLKVSQPQHSDSIRLKNWKYYGSKSDNLTLHQKSLNHKGKFFEGLQNIKKKIEAKQEMQVSKPSGQTVERIQLVNEKGNNTHQNASSKAQEAKHNEELKVSKGKENEQLESVTPTEGTVQQSYHANTTSSNVKNITALKDKLNLMKAKTITKQKGNKSTKLEKVSATGTAQQLLAELDKLKFGHDPGTVWHSSRFRYVKQCGLFVEQYNVTKVDASWSDNLWQPYPYLYDVPTNYHTCKAASWMNDTDLRGDVFLSFEVHLNKGRTEQDHARVCSNICCREERCRAWTLRFQKATTRNCPKNTFCCWLKSAVPSPIPNQAYCTSGIVGRKKSRHPPPGMRSAVPLGGMGTGSFELRADGTFHEWTIENQSPGGSAKLNKGALDLAVFGVRVKSDGRSKSSLLRVHPPHGYPGVAALTYSGAFPITKLSPAGLVTREVDMDLYAYPAFHPRDSRKSATPAVAFTLGLHNTRGKVPKDVSFMFNLPLGVQHDTIRAGSNFGEVVFTRLIKPSDCAYACDKMPKCVSWTTNGPTSCMLKNKMPLHSWAPGIVTGLKGEWSLEKNMLTMKRPGFFAQSGSTTLYTSDNKETNASFAVADNFKEIWKRFSETGMVGASGSAKRLGLYGAVSLQTVLKPGESKSLTIIMSWYYPHRDISHVHVGNFYSNLFSSSKDAALHMRKDLFQSVKDIRSWQDSFLQLSAEASDSSGTEEEKVKRLPVWLQDMMMNSVSFWRSGFWTEDQRWRQWEALDCNKIDSVHNDMLRIMPYVLFYPEFVRDLLVSWSKAQLSDGMIEEALTTGCLGKTEKLDYAGGRNMGDGTALFVVELYHYYLWTNDTELLDRLWPAAKRAALWSMGEATKGTDLPFRKVNGYDLLALDKYDHSIYNSIVYLLTLRAAEKLADVRNDSEFGKLIKNTYAKASKRVDVELWDKQKGFYHAWWDMEYGSPAWIMSDSLYGQVWAYTLGLGELLDVKKLRSHLEKEVENNDTPFGLKALTTESKELTLEDTSVILGRGVPSCRSLENITKHNSVWMGADSNWATNMIHLGVNPSRALNRAQKALDHWRTTLNDQWNIHGLTSSSGYGQDGLPWANSHHSSHLVMWHIPLALSGQQYSAPDASLTFWPRYKVPYELPFFTPTASGTIKAKLSTSDNEHKEIEEMYTFTVASGKLFLKRLAVTGSTYGKGEINLRQGDTVSWSKPQNTIRDILSQLKH